MKLYEIDRAIMDCIDFDTGEIIDEARLDALKMDREAKIDGVVSYYKAVCAESEAIKAEISALKERFEQKERKADGLKDYIGRALSGERFETPRNKVGWRKSDEVTITKDDLIPPKFVTYMTVAKIDKNAIKKAIKSGAAVPGAELVMKNNIQIK